MGLLTTKQLLQEFESRASRAVQIDIAVAWATPSRAFELLRRAAGRGTRVRVVVGLSGNSTTPPALRGLQRFADVRIGKSRTGIFHPKFYLFSEEGRRRCWIGSANFTVAGFGQHTELVHEFFDEGGAAEWFEDIWRAAGDDSDREIDDYCRNWQRPQRQPSANAQSTGAGEEQRFALLSRVPPTWADYVAALRKCDEIRRNSNSFFTVLGEEWSYVETITVGHEITRQPDWGSLTNEEIDILLPRKAETGAWVLLGSMKPARIAAKAFRESSRTRRQIQELLRPVVGANTEREFIAACEQSLNEADSIRGFASGVLTRLIALARPDRGLSVNNGSAVGLGQLAHLSQYPQILGKPHNYGRLLQWLYAQPWYQSPEPQDNTKALWEMRAALVDCFVYDTPAHER